jgi:hypothetical protein
MVKTAVIRAENATIMPAMAGKPGLSSIIL